MAAALPAPRRLVLSVALLTAIILASVPPAAAAPQAGPAAAPAGPQPRKAIAPAGVLDASTPGVVLWHDYDAFGLYQLSDAALAGLRSKPAASY